LVRPRRWRQFASFAPNDGLLSSGVAVLAAMTLNLPQRAGSVSVRES
jgi:hypothetical protein